MIDSSLPNLSRTKQYIVSRKSDFVFSLYLMLRQRRGSFFLHWLNTLLSKVVRRAPRQVAAGEDFWARGYAVRAADDASTTGNEKLKHDLLAICDYMENAPREAAAGAKYVLLGNFFFIQNALRNQTHFDRLPPHLLAALAESLKGSELMRVAEAASGCELTVCNLRCWLFYPLAGPEDSNVHAHTDFFPPGFLKIMFYQGSFTPAQPAINVHAAGGVTPVTGIDPLLLFDANRVVHDAPAPVSGCRPTVEFTLMPRGLSDYRILQAGFQAGYPLNPFASYDRPYSMLYSR